MERMHPHDLRAKLAMDFYKLAALATDSEDRSRDLTIQWSVGSADLLLAELERTAKPDPNHAAVEHWRQECGKLWSRVGKAEARVMDLERSNFVAIESARIDGANTERERLAPYLRHHTFCRYGEPPRVFMDGGYPCSCGLKELIENTPENP